MSSSSSLLMSSSPSSVSSASVTKSSSSSSFSSSTSSSSSASSKTLLGSILFFRHGSRAVTKSCVRNLKIFTAAQPDLHVESEWGPDETEYITTVGENQLRTIGQWFSEVYLPRTYIHSNNNSSTNSTTSHSLYSKTLQVLQTHQKNSSLPYLKWRSSESERVIASGEQFWKIIQEKLPSLASVCPSKPLPYVPYKKPTDSSTTLSHPIPLITMKTTGKELLDLNEVPFAMGPSYYSDEIYHRLEVLRHCENMEKAALRVRNELESIYTKVTGHSTLPSLPSSTETTNTNNNNKDQPLNHMEPILDATKDTTIDPAKDLDDIELVSKLWCIYNVKELYDCEVAWPGTATALRNPSSFLTRTTTGKSTSSTEPAEEDDTLPGEEETKHPSSSSQSSSTDNHHHHHNIAVLADVKNMLLQRITEKDENFINHSSHWLWDQRYFSDYMFPYTSKLGTQHLLELLADLQSMVINPSSSYPFAIYSGHDHTIYTILAGLRAKNLPRVTLGFCAYLLFEVYRDENVSKLNPKDPLAGVSVTIKLNDTPFPRSRDGLPLDFEPDRYTIVCEDVDLNGLLQHVEKQYRAFRYEVQQEFMKKMGNEGTNATKEKGELR